MCTLLSLVYTSVMLILEGRFAVFEMFYSLMIGIKIVFGVCVFVFV